MTYTSGGLIQATDYNGFVSTTSGANVNNVWSTGSGDAGWGQSATVRGCGGGGGSRAAAAAAAAAAATSPTKGLQGVTRRRGG